MQSPRLSHFRHVVNVHDIDEETEGQSPKMTCLRLHSQETTKVTWESKSWVL